jgi:tyrosine-protein kinase Etk/Wzc
MRMYRIGCQAGLDYARALREVKYRETIQDRLMRQYEGAGGEEACQAALVQIADSAVVPDRPASRHRLWIVLGAIFCSLPLASLTAAVAEVIAIVYGSWVRSAGWAATFEERMARAWR